MISPENISGDSYQPAYGGSSLRYDFQLRQRQHQLLILLSVKAIGSQFLSYCPAEAGSPLLIMFFFVLFEFFVVFVISVVFCRLSFLLPVPRSLLPILH